MALYAGPMSRFGDARAASGGPAPSPEDQRPEDDTVEALRARVAELEARLAPAPALTEVHGLKQQLSTIVLFGADGNLATKKTYPTLFALWRKRLLPRDVVVVGYARAEMDTAAFRKVVYRAIYSSAHAQRERQSFLRRCHYVGGQFDVAEHVRDRLASKVRELEGHQAAGKCLDDGWSTETGDDERPLAKKGPATQRVRVYYMAVPPFLYAAICRCLRDGGLRRPADEAGLPTRHRFVLEKPFGRDAQSCRALCQELGALVREDEAYRIDHYLGKELVMNVLVLRFANVCFGAVWNRTHVQRVEICCHEEIGTLGRGGYFDTYGIIRDVMQNHLAQILALVAMEQPLSLDAKDVKREKVKALRSVRPLDASSDLIVGQFDGYVDDDTVKNKQSKTETFAAARLFVDNPRWAGVPFVLTAGKALAQKKVEVRVVFRAVAGALAELRGAPPNELVVRVQPDECIYWRVANRVPGLGHGLAVEPRRMNLLYTPSEARDMPEAYERLILEVLQGDATNFVSVEELDAAWDIFSPALAALAARPKRPEVYSFGSPGPSVQKFLGDAAGEEGRPRVPEEPTSPGRSAR
mmetsp:Transcript_26220/g.78653  ORF Transcript_26220/g.78653 Transcript_26220/m.78653 type:complete len:583 (-) Transcript_26220:33-1781(-)